MGQGKLIVEVDDGSTGRQHEGAAGKSEGILRRAAELDEFNITPGIHCHGRIVGDIEGGIGGIGRAGTGSRRHPAVPVSPCRPVGVVPLAGPRRADGDGTNSKGRGATYAKKQQDQKDKGYLFDRMPPSRNASFLSIGPFIVLMHCADDHLSPILTQKKPSATF